MSAFFKSVGVMIIGGIVGGATPAVGGGDAKTIAASALASAVVALFGLWLHRPGSEPQASQK